MSLLRAFYRLAGFLLFTLAWVVCFGLVRLFCRDKLAAGIRWRSFWEHIMLPFLGIKASLKHIEEINTSPVIYVANHRSYIDPVIALHYSKKAVIVAKAELSKWPLLGAGAGMGGVLFVQRSSRESRSETLELMGTLLDKNFSLVVFPEGTTTKAPGFLPFKSGAFRLAAQKNIPVVPMAIEFEDTEDAWVGDDTFLRHFFQTFRKRKISIRMSIGPPISHNNYEDLKEIVHEWIANELIALQR